MRFLEVFWLNRFAFYEFCVTSLFNSVSHISLTDIKEGEVQQKNSDRNLGLSLWHHSEEEIRVEPTTRGLSYPKSPWISVFFFRWPGQRVRRGTHTFFLFFVLPAFGVSVYLFACLPSWLACRLVLFVQAVSVFFFAFLFACLFCCLWLGRLLSFGMFVFFCCFVYLAVCLSDWLISSRPLWEGQTPVWGVVSWARKRVWVERAPGMEDTKWVLWVLEYTKTIQKPFQFRKPTEAHQATGFWSLGAAWLLRLSQAELRSSSGSEPGSQHWQQGPLRHLQPFRQHPLLQGLRNLTPKGHRMWCLSHWKRLFDNQKFSKSCSFFLMTSRGGRSKRNTKDIYLKEWEKMWRKISGQPFLCRRNEQEKNHMSQKKVQRNLPRWWFANDTNTAQSKTTRMRIDLSGFKMSLELFVFKHLLVFLWG